MNTIPPNDFSYFEMLNEIVQQEPATSLDPELMGPIAAIGIVKGKPFAPDARMKKILTEAVVSANATSRSLFMNPRDPSWFYYPGSAWMNPLFVSGYQFETPIPMITRSGRQAVSTDGLPATGRAPLVLLRRHRHHAGHGHARDRHRLAVPLRHARCRQELLRRRQDLQGDAAQGDSGSELLVVDALRQPDALDARHAAALPACWQPELSDRPPPNPTPTAPRRCTSAPKQPDGVKRGNWIQTMPGKGWFAILRLYSPLEPFFTKEWRVSEIEQVSEGTGGRALR